MTRIGIIGPYSHRSKEERDYNVLQARIVSALIIKSGHTPLCAYTMYEGLEHVEDLTYDDFMRCGRSILLYCDVVVRLPGWQDSPGAQAESRYCESVRMEIYDLDDLAPCQHPERGPGGGDGCEGCPGRPDCWYWWIHGGLFEEIGRQIAMRGADTDA